MEERTNPKNIEISLFIFKSTIELHIFYSYIDFNKINCEQTVIVVVKKE